MPDRLPRTPLLAALVLTAGLLAWALARSPPPDPADPETPEASAVDPVPAAPSPPAAGPARSRPRSPAAPDDPIPRVLPPDAAVEDVRDILALPPDERAALLGETLAALGRIANRDPRVLAGLHAMIDGEEDALLRAVSQVGLATERSAANRAWLRARLAGAADARERLGALVALARRPDDDTSPAAPRARSAALGGLRYVPAPLPESESLRDALVDFLASVEGDVAREAVPILRLSVRASALYAAALVGKDGEVCRWLKSLPDDERASVCAAALEQPELPPAVRAALKRAS